MGVSAWGVKGVKGEGPWGRDRVRRSVSSGMKREGVFLYVNNVIVFFMSVFSLFSVYLCMYSVYVALGPKQFFSMWH